MTRRNPHTHASAKAKKKKKKSRRAPAARRWRSASNSDRHELYELSVQDPANECEFIDQVWRDLHRTTSSKAKQTPRRRGATLIREDFCGTAAMSAQWVKHRPGNTAIAVDLDPAVIQWGLGRSDKRGLKPAHLERLTFVVDDVLKASTPRVDTVLALNFSYFIFKTRDALRAYFKRVRAALVDDGLFILDAYGGYESFAEMEEEKDMDGFTYVWDQNMVNPITGEVLNHIHFKFPDGTVMRKAFTYAWRLWTLPELQEVLKEAGFSNSVVYWEGTNHRTGEGNGEWATTTRGEACAGWIAYLVAQK